MGNKLLPKRFNLEQRRPSVLLFGNGMVRCLHPDSDWNMVIRGLAKDGKDDLASDIFPYSIRATVTTDTNDVVRRADYTRLFEEKYQYQPNELITDLMKIRFDAVLTTNYTYELEYALNEKYPSLNVKKTFRHTLDYIPEVFHKSEAAETEPESDPKGKPPMPSGGLLRTFNRVRYQDIWHIHGDITRSSSCILTHDEYGRLMGAILNYNRLRGGEIGKIRYMLNEDGSPRATEFNFCSWFDYFIYGDLYILGQGFDFAEFDLWWLISRRQRAEEAGIGTGKAVFFNPLGSEGTLSPVEKALNNLGVVIEDCGFQLTGDEEKDRQVYTDFYRAATRKLSALGPMIEQTEAAISE